VPTLAAVLDSKKRPGAWTRTFDSTAYDQAAVGWKFTPTGLQAAEPNAGKRVRIYDTTLLGYGNKGHTYGMSSPTTSAARCSSTQDPLVPQASALAATPPQHGPGREREHGEHAPDPEQVAHVRRRRAARYIGANARNVA